MTSTKANNDNKKLKERAAAGIEWGRQAVTEISQAKQNERSTATKEVDYYFTD